jgi:EAL domain-containing protein (putative c-di-GMP-specific phosphodiesterase class I)
MSKLIQLIYSSAARHAMSPREIKALLTQSRRKNAKAGISGMLLYINGSFFQVLEGEEKAVDALFSTISKDSRHTNITTIIREPIAKRAFTDWSMGYTDLSEDDADAILGINDFFGRGDSFNTLTQGRAKKLLLAFKEGRWRSRLSDATHQEAYEPTAPYTPPASGAISARLPEDACPYTFAFQPIVNVTTAEVFSYEALIRGHHHESAPEVLSKINAARKNEIDQQCRIQAIKLAASLGLSTHLNLNLLPKSIETLPSSIRTVLETIKACGLLPEQIIIEVLEHEFISDPDHFRTVVNEYRSSGLLFAIDDFGSGYAGLNLLADFQPDFIKLDMQLVHQIDRKGPRQAIIRGIVRTCFDLGIEIIAEGVETREEYDWLRGEGIGLFQGFLFSAPAFEALPNPQPLLPRN